MNKYFHSCNPKRLICLAAVLISFIFLFVPQNEGVAAQAQNALFVTFIDVGQGDCSLLRTSNGTNILIDAGPTSTGQAVLSNLYDQGVSSLDVIIISHNHEDHIGGLLTIFQSEIQAGEVLYNGSHCTTATCLNVWSAMTDRGINSYTTQVGDFYTWDTLTATILNPQETLTDNENEDSIVMNTSFSGHHILYTGDIGFSTESLLINQGVLSNVDVLKVAHHGSAYSTSSEFLNAVAPQNAVISVGKNNSYGHPNDDTLSCLIASGADLHRTDIDGDIDFLFSENSQVNPFVETIFIPLVFVNHTSSAPPSPSSMPGENIQCKTIGQVEICASVSNANPPKYSHVTVYGRLLINNVPQSGKSMTTSCHYKTTTSYCNEGVTESNGIANCHRNISGATAGYKVNIDVTIDGYSIQTSFIPTN